MPSPLKDSKRALRAALKKALMEMPAARREAESAALCEAVRRLPEYRRAGTVALFCPMPFEVNLLDLLNDSGLFTREAADRKTPAGQGQASKPGPGPEPEPVRRFVFPLTHDDRSLTWHEIRSPAELVPGRMGIPEPDPAGSPAVDPGEIELVLVPGLGFSADGGRLGFGGGYYDRFLAKAGPGTATVAACLSCQMVPAESLPVEPHDIPVQRVLHG